jgi:16S rRNA (uracil1498-N3)-methyltransferase
VPLPRFFAPDARVDAASLALSADESHHLTHVLRLKAGDQIRVFDGAGGEWQARVRAVSRRVVEVTLGQPVAPVAEPSVHVTLGVGWLKGAQMDAVVRDATALGVAAIVPIATDHVDVPSARRDGAGLDRWRRLAVASVKQCRRAVVPEVGPVSTLDALCDAAIARGDLIVMCVEPAVVDEVDAPGLDAARPAGGATALVGPEGGWSAAEVSRVGARGGRLIALGTRTLRAETVPTVLLSALWTRWGW